MTSAVKAGPCRGPLFKQAHKLAGPAARLFFRVAFLMAVCFGATAALAEKNDTWLLIETGKMRLSVLRGNVVMQTYPNISVGRGGTTWDKQRRDGKTPLGEFHIVNITSDTSFHLFFGIDYPDLERAERARQAGIIDQPRYAAIRQAVRARRLPPQDTVLGGHIGIHGVGAGNPAVHEDFNWTYGCIALTNAQIDDLSRWVRVGMRVSIRR